MSITLIPRGPGPLVSILLPTRGRPGHLYHAVDSLYSLAKDKGNLEFIFKADTDDPETIDAVEKLAVIPGLKVKNIISPRGNGYFDMHHWVNDMARQATGDWLLLFNDDARMTTQDWDTALMHIGTGMPWFGIADVCLIMAQTIGRPFANEFIILRRKTFEILGHISLSPHNDNWIYGVMEFLRVRLTAPIHIEHLSEKIGDAIRESTVEAYKTTTISLNSIESKGLQLEDVAKLYNYLVDFESRVVWGNDPTPFSWSIWRNSYGINQTMFVDAGGNTFSFVKNENKEGKSELIPQPCKVVGGKWAVLQSYRVSGT